LRKNNLNNKSFDKNLLKEKQFNEQPSLSVRGKNFLVNDNELRNLGEGKNIPTPVLRDILPKGGKGFN
jgi:hypothetical protein